MRSKRRIRIGAVTRYIINRYGKSGETNEMVLRRAFKQNDLDISAGIPRRKPNLPGLTYNDFMPILLSILRSSPSGAHISSVIAYVRKSRISSRFTKDDFVLTGRGNPRWINQIHMARLALVTKGYLHPPEWSGAGVWELTEKGRKFADEVLSKTTQEV